MSLFQEDNICQSNIWSSITKVEMTLAVEHAYIITVCTEQVRSPYTELAASGLPNSTHLEGEVRFAQAQDQQVVSTRRPRIVTECLLTRSMLIKMYVYAIYSRLSIGTISSIRQHGYEFITTLSLSSLMSPFSLSCPPLSC